jgi:hypothetical protein
MIARTLQLLVLRHCSMTLHRSFVLVDHVRATTEGRLQPLRSFVMKSKSIDSCQQQQQLQMQGFITAGVKSEFERRGEKRKQLISIFFFVNYLSHNYFYFYA